MGDDSPDARQSKVNLPIKGMESVVATVTGYTGTERFNLIKLISVAGGNYVGTMSKSITHLFCWKYEGRKYELASQFDTVIVNHQWIEDCIKEGRRLPEVSYTLRSGQEVGPLILNIPFITNKSRDPNLQNDQNKEQSRHRSKRNITKGSPRQENSSPRTYCSSNPHSSGSQREEKKGKHASPEISARSHKRRLVKKNMRKETLNLISDSELETPRQEAINDQYGTRAVSSNSVQNEECRLGGIRGGQNRTEVLNDVEDVNNVHDILDHDAESLNINGASSSYVWYADANGKDMKHVTRLPTSAEMSDANGKDMKHANKLPTSAEMSCVICWTEFSATRGVLPCGHRFCFSCIQSWADLMTSSRKTSTCPLCKASFIIITKVDNAVSSDQKIYSQTVPLDDPRMDIYILPAGETQKGPSNSSGAPVCCHCSCREPEDLLERCEVCEIQHIHVYCLDPPSFPWTCSNCKDLRRLYLHRR